MMQYRVSYDAVIIKLAPGNPRRPGSKAHGRFGLYRTGMTVREYLEAGGLIGDIYCDIARCHIVTSDFPYNDVARRVRESGMQLLAEDSGA